VPLGVATGKELRTFAAHKGRVSTVVFPPTARLASSSLDKTVRLWDLVTGSEIRIPAPSSAG
jgi:WD40 repeat protein